MSVPKSDVLRLHEDKVRFREAVNATGAATGFAPRLVEKDYFCTVLLHYLAPLEGMLIFKGGTCLAKVHAGFYRLSEDLDFVIPTPIGASRTERSRRARNLKGLLAKIDVRLPGIDLLRALAGANNSTQYIAVFGYTSLLRTRVETIQFKVGLREPLLTPAMQAEAKTLLLDPVSGSSLVPIINVPSLSLDEMMAEKLRAALCRRDVAIRDFYDIDHAVRRMGLRLDDPELLGLVRQKLAVPGNEPPDRSGDRLEALRSQVETELKPVLRERDFREFDLDRAFGIVAEMARRLSECE